MKVRSFLQKSISLKHFLFASLFLSHLIGNAQINSSGWIDYNHRQFLNSKLAVVGDVGYRTDFDGDGFNLTYIRPGMSYQLNTTFRLQANVALFQTINQNSSDISELRLAQEVKAAWPRFVGFRFGHRFRLEERFFYFQESEGAENGSGRDQNVRLRYFLDGTTEPTNIGFLQNIYFTASIEFFANTGEEREEFFSNQSRVYGGWGQIYKGWGYVLHLMWLRSRNTIGNFEANEFVVRLRINFNSKIPERAVVNE